MEAVPFPFWPPSSLSCYENWSHLRINLAEHLAWQLLLHIPHLEGGRDGLVMVLMLMEARRTWVQLPPNPRVLALLWESMPLGGQSPSQMGQLESHLTSFFPSSLGGFWWNSAVPRLGEMHVFLHVLHRECVFCHRVPLDSVHFSEQLLAPHIVTFCSGSQLSGEEGWV